MGYQAGTLDLSIIGNSGVAVDAINKTVKALNNLSSSVKKMQGVNFTFAGQKLQMLFEKIASATNSINVDNLNKLSVVAKSMSSISSIGKLEKVNYEKVAAGFSQLTIAITPFINKVKEGEVSLRSLYGITSKFNGRIFGGQNQSGGFFNFAKMGVSLYLVRRFVRYAADIVNSGSDYIETMNLWQVAMRHNIDLAEEFVDKMNKAYGVSTKTTMQAQATFRNMIGSLGDLSVETSQKLSEAITQMAYDYSSLYNVQLSQAVDKFQSALAGQVRPIRSISGYDITEKTIHALYESLGGTKTQRQLSRTEKQLLAILAVFRQMESAGATGDLGKTLDNFANQSRMMVENFTELKSWTGLLIVDLFESWGLMIKINAALITATTIVKAIAKSRGVGDKNFINGIFESATEANEAVDELQGKLLDFDKIRALDTAQGASDISIDEKLLQAISGYTSIISESENKAKNLADTWLEIFGATRDSNGELVFSQDALDDIVDKAKSLLGIVSAIPAFLMGKKMLGNWKAAALVSFFTYAYTASDQFRNSINTLANALLDILNPSLRIVINLLTPILDTVNLILKPLADIVSFIDDIGALEPLIYAIASAFVYLKMVVIDGKGYFDLFGKTINGVWLGIGFLVYGIMSFVNVWDDMSWAERATTGLLAIAAAIGAIVVGVKALKMDWAGAIGFGAMAAGTVLTIQSAGKIPNSETGASDIDSGTVFRAGEFGKTEAVYTGSNGKTNVANVQQMKAAFYQALVEYGHDYSGGDETVHIHIGEEETFRAVRKRANREGLDFVRKG